MIIKILGSGCKNCKTLENNTRKAIEELRIDAEIVKVEDFKEIMKYGVMTTPALVVDEKVLSFGKVLKTKDIVKLLRG
ncbi:thioredoxin family protein [Wansuia hejianensis]|uniref:TM0996/MTH895 family glutaredoxin-like protein n=1 Tax=Wansuia hejianensis TaxID=2763667 RepID=A0A926F175_9FIRM|nr:thioredoxin family protein [Wansuia hejianensis]MBC8590019.1 TM0996/MTH895 family glutaredoxin-like protein [Wansuia hejianensis]